MKIKRTKSGRQEIVKGPGEGNQYREGSQHRESGQHSNSREQNGGVNSDSDQGKSFGTKDIMGPVGMKAPQPCLSPHGDMNGSGVTGNVRQGTTTTGLQLTSTIKTKVDA